MDREDLHSGIDKILDSVDDIKDLVADKLDDLKDKASDKLDDMKVEAEVAGGDLLNTACRYTNVVRTAVVNSEVGMRDFKDRLEKAKIAGDWKAVETYAEALNKYSEELRAIAAEMVEKADAADAQAKAALAEEAK